MKSIQYVAVSLLLVAFSIQPVVADGDSHPMLGMSAPMIYEVESPYDFEGTVQRIGAEIKATGWKVPKTYDWVKIAEKGGGDIGGPMVMYELCKPEHAIAILKQDAFKHLSVLMPCALSIYQKRDGKTYVAYLNVDMIAGMYGPGISEIAHEAGHDRDQIFEFLKK